MTLASKLGSPDSLLGGIELGSTAIGPQTFTKNVSHNLSLIDSVSTPLSDIPEAPMTLTSKLGSPDSLLGGIELGDGAAIGPQTFTQSVSQNLSLTDSVSFHLADIPESVSDVLALAQVVTVHVVRVLTVTDTLSITQSVAQGNVISKSVSQSLGITDAASAGHDIHASASDTLALVQTVRSSIINISVTDTLSLVDSVIVRGPIYMDVRHNLNLSQSGDENQNPVTRLVTDVIVLTDKAGLVIPVSVSQSLGITDSGARLNIGHDILNLVQSVTVGKGGDVTHALGITDAVHVQAMLIRSLADTISLKDFAAYLLVGGCRELNYNPFIGGGTVSGYTPPTTTPPTLSHAITTLTYPFVTPTSTLVLRNAAFGNHDRLAFNRINRETRGGTLIIFADPTWPKIQTLSLQINTLKGQQILDLRTFLAASLGKEIGLLDHENRQWRGVITNPNSALTQAGRDDRSVTIEFEGTLA